MGKIQPIAWAHLSLANTHVKEKQKECGLLLTSSKSVSVELWNKNVDQTCSTGTSEPDNARKLLWNALF